MDQDPRVRTFTKKISKIVFDHAIHVQASTHARFPKLITFNANENFPPILLILWKCRLLLKAPSYALMLPSTNGESKKTICGASKRLPTTTTPCRSLLVRVPTPSRPVPRCLAKYLIFTDEHQIVRSIERFSVRDAEDKDKLALFEQENRRLKGIEDSVSELQLKYIEARLYIQRLVEVCWQRRQVSRRMSY
jgi:hypothetical protein